MTDAVLTSIIAAIPPTLAAGFGVWISGRNSRGIQQVHNIVNGMNKKKMKLTKSDSFRRGKAAEKKNPGSPVRKSPPRKS